MVDYYTPARGIMALTEGVLMLPEGRGPLGRGPSPRDVV